MWNMKEIMLTQNKIAIIDERDYKKVSSHKWCWMKSKYNDGYAMRNGGGYVQLMHRFIMGESHKYIDHINGDTLDNRRKNLRVVTNAQNSMNSRPRGNKKYKGVSYIGRGNKRWRAYICIDGKQKCLQTYFTEIEAAQAYNMAAKKYFGEYARLNKICWNRSML